MNIVVISTRFIARLAAAIAATMLALPAMAETIPVSTSGELMVALAAASEGDVIELAHGTYLAPNGGFEIQDPGASFVVRAAVGATVILDGAGIRPILKFVNSTLDLSSTVVFERLVFDRGFSSDPQIGAAVTLIESAATFVECTFTNNVSTGELTGGAGIFMRDGAVAHVFDSLFQDNTANKEGAAMRLRNMCEARIHGSTFINNRTDPQGHHDSSSGGAINLYDSRIAITDSTFQGNVAGCFGGAVYVKGIYDETPGYASELLIANSLFEGNETRSQAGVDCGQPTIAGAIHLENEVQATVYSSRFIENQAEMGGAFGNFRGQLEISDSVFLGNRAYGTDSAAGTGGALHSNSNDVADGSTNDGQINRPSASMIVRRSYFQGRYGDTGAAANKGACVYARGDSNRSYGVGVPQDGTPQQNRVTLEFTDCVFSACDSGFSEDGDGGAMALNHADLTMTDTVMIGNDAGGSTGNGGAMRLTVASSADITNSWFQGNTSGNRAAVFMVSGSDLSASGSVFAENVVRSGAKGSVIWSKPTTATLDFPDIDVNGTIDGCTFLLNDGQDIQESDNAGGPVNAMTFSGNSFLTNPVDGFVFNSSINPGNRNVDDLNAFVAVRNLGVGDTDKAPNDDNVVLTAAPAMGVLSAAPQDVFQDTPTHGPLATRDVHLAWGWIGGAATLDGSPLSGDSGFGVGASGGGSHTLDVANGDASESVVVLTAPVPAVDLIATPDAISGGETSDLVWNTWSGSFVDVGLDRGLVISQPVSGGQVTVSPGASMTYRVHVVTSEGGAVADERIAVDELAPGELFSDGFETGNTQRWSSVTGF